MCPMKASTRRSPRYRNSHGNRKGLTRLTVNMLFNGRALSEKIIVPPLLGPHQRLFLPNENCQLPRVRPKYVSSSRKRLMDAVGSAGPVGQPSVLLKKFSMDCVGAGPEGAY